MALSLVGGSLLSTPGASAQCVDPVTGEPAAAIVEFARSENVDLIVMGTHGRTGFSRLLMGSVAEAVVRKAPCPVLTLKEPAAKTAAV